MTDIYNKTDQNIFFWKNLIVDSQDLEEPVHYKKPFYNPILDLEEVKSVFIGMSNDSYENTSSLVRVYINGLDSAEYVQTVSNLPPTLSESLEEWTYRIFKKERFCIIVNSANRWSEALSIKVGGFVTPLLKRFPIPQISVDVTLIVGNYTYTPFGIHLDDPHHRTLHLHLGPGKKYFFLWEKDVFRSLTGSEDNYYKPEQISGHRHIFEVSPQDTFLLPAKYYHVCKTEEFTVGAAITFTKNTKEKLFLESCGNSLKDLAFYIEECSSKKYFIPELIQYQNIASEVIAKVNLEKWLEQSLKYYIYKKDSNLGFRKSPLECSMPFSHLAQLKRRKVRLCHPYKIFTYPQNEIIHIFVRHNHFTLKNLPVIQSLINFINDYKIIKVSTILQEYSSLITEDAVLGILILFIRFRGIEIIT